MKGTYQMDTRDGTIYDTIEDAKAAGVPDRFLVQGTREALEHLKARIKFTKGSFKNVRPDDAQIEQR